MSDTRNSKTEVFHIEVPLLTPSEPYTILMVLDQPFPPDIRVENEVSSLVSAGFEVIVLAMAPDTRVPIEKQEGVTIVRCHVHKKFRNWMRGLSGTLPILSWFIAWQIRRLRKKYQFDVIHAHDLYMCGGALRAARSAKVPVVADLHEFWIAAIRQYAWSTRFPGKLFVSIRRWRTLEKKWINQLKRIIVTSEGMKIRYSEIGYSKKKILVLPNTINTQLFDEYPVYDSILQKYSSGFTLVYTGGINLHRGLEYLIDSMPHVLDQCDVRLVIVGDGATRSELEAQVMSLGISDHVIFEGWRPQAEIKSYILAGNVCLLPLVKSDHTDGATAHKLFHYMYLSRPLIITNCTQMQRIVEETDCGLVVSYGDCKALAAAIIELYNNSERRNQMAVNGHRAVIERYNWAESAHSLIKMYQEMAIESEIKLPDRELELPVEKDSMG